MSVRATADLPAPSARVWAELVDFGRMNEWFFGVRRLSVVPAEGGLGAERRLTLAWGQTHRERITAWEPGRRFALDVLDPPLFARDFRAAIEVRPAGPGARLDWEMSFAPRFGPIGRALGRAAVGPVLRFALRRSVRRLADRLERAGR